LNFESNSLYVNEDACSQFVLFLTLLIFTVHVSRFVSIRTHILSLTAPCSVHERCFIY